MEARRAARLLAGCWTQGSHREDLPPDCRPATRADGYAVQALWPAETGRPVAGWKIAATSLAGQQHIAVSGPLAGPVFAHRVHADGARVSLAANRMRVAECEIVFSLGRALAPRAQRYGRDEVLAAVASVHPGIEVPDSRFLQFERAGEAQLIADCACSNDMVLGAALPADGRLGTLPTLQVQAQVSDGRKPQGLGSNVLGDPVEALVWLVNELSSAGQTIEPGQFVTTGACVPPIPVLPGQDLEADFGWIGRIRASFA
ncbi:fumarylacetoacetate hydrolase family protein [Ramlibacter sp. 2FC]|uniref:2-keto-4-pentenoate hydratase n=1 Tax=Ramlibacter sp. 2FC TaxID=2502188 RepID=UPI00201DF7BB|nr:fumarylacetoacetate hydrolase family protein [Ramlibacter sp. 2FC]